MDWITINNSKINNFKNLLKNKSQFFIPTYQRNYVWKKNYINHFLATVDNLLYKNDDFNYFGNITLIIRDDVNYLEIIDGQQRVTTFLLFIIAIFNNYKIVVREYNNLPKNDNVKFNAENLKNNELITKYNNIFKEFIYFDEERKKIKIFYFEDFFNSKEKNNRNKIFKTLLDVINVNQNEFCRIEDMELNVNSDLYKIWHQKTNFILNFKHFNEYLSKKIKNEFTLKSKLLLLEKILNIIYDFKIGIINITDDKYVNQYFEQINTYKEKLKESDLIKNLLFSDYYRLSDDLKKEFDYEWIKIFNLLVDHKNDKMRFSIGNYFFYYCFLYSKGNITKSNIFKIVKEKFVLSENKITEFNKINTKMEGLILLFNNFSNNANEYDKTITSSTKIIIDKLLILVWNNKEYDNNLLNIFFVYINIFTKKIITAEELLKFIEITILLYYKRFFFNDERTHSHWEGIKNKITGSLNNKNKNKAMHILRNYYMQEENEVSIEKIINKSASKINKWSLLLHLLYVKNQLKKLNAEKINNEEFENNIQREININFIFPPKPTRLQQKGFPEILRIEKINNIGNLTLCKTLENIIFDDSVKFTKKIYRDLIVRYFLFVDVFFDKTYFNYDFFQERETNIGEAIYKLIKKWENKSYLKKYQAFK